MKQNLDNLALLIDNVAKQASPMSHLPKTAIKDLNISLLINGEACQTGNSNAILGNPVESIIELSKMSLKYEQPIEQGAIILAGAATSAEYIHLGDKIEGHFEHLGLIKLEVV